MNPIWSPGDMPARDEVQGRAAMPPPPMDALNADAQPYGDLSPCPFCTSLAMHSVRPAMPCFVLKTCPTLAHTAIGVGIAVRTLI